MKLSIFLLASLLFAACSSDGTSTAECVDLCEDAQDGSCTSITGNCSSFCDALDAVDDPSGCSSQRASYQSCLGDGVDVCDNDCDSQETALSNCLASYCASRPSDPDCATLIGSF